MTGFADDPAHTEDLHAWHVLQPLLQAGGYLPWSTGAMRAAGLVLVCNEIVLGNRTAIVECGSGASTVLIARLLRERDQGTLVAVEHDPRWAALVTGQLRREGLQDTARVVYAPLTGDPLWYDHAALTGLPDVIDLLVVDGPPADKPGTGLRRAPALEFFDPRLSEDAIVVLDDVDRTGERDVLARWEEATAWRFEIDPSHIAVGSRRPSSRRPATGS